MPFEFERDESRPKTFAEMLLFSEDIIRTMTYDEIEGFLDAFVMFDSDKSCEIDCAELGAAMRALGHNPTEQVL